MIPLRKRHFRSSPNTQIPSPRRHFLRPPHSTGHLAGTRPAGSRASRSVRRHRIRSTPAPERNRTKPNLRDHLRLQPNPPLRPCRRGRFLHRHQRPRNRVCRPASASRSKNRGMNHRSGRPPLPWIADPARVPDRALPPAQAKLVHQRSIRANRPCGCPRGSRNSPVPVRRRAHKLFPRPISRPETSNRHLLDRQEIQALSLRTSAACSICRHARSPRPSSRRQFPRRA